jgi:hypothetical protein
MYIKTSNKNHANLTQNSLSPTTRDKEIKYVGNELFKAMDQHWWKLTIDKNMHHEGPDAFESTPGYLEGMKNGFEFMLDTLPEPVSPDLLLAFHDVCVDNVYRKLSDKAPAVLSKNQLDTQRDAMNEWQLKNGNPKIPEIRDFYKIFKDGNVFVEGFNQKTDEPLYLIVEPYKIKDEFKDNPILNKFIDDAVLFDKGFRPETYQAEFDMLVNQENSGGHLTDAGFAEIEKKCTNNGPYSSFGKLTKKSDDVYAWSSAPMSEEKIKGHIDYATRIYEADISLAKTPQEKLGVIADFCQHLILLHPFSDGNGRAIGQVLLNKCLIENDFTPVILDNPNNLGGFSRDEFVSEIKKGFINYENALPGNNTSFGCAIL